MCYVSLGFRPRHSDMCLPWTVKATELTPPVSTDRVVAQTLVSNCLGMHQGTFQSLIYSLECVSN